MLSHLKIKKQLSENFLLCSGVPRLLAETTLLFEKVGPYIHGGGDDDDDDDDDQIYQVCVIKIIMLMMTGMMMMRQGR